jgi:hypothetical protein
MNRNEKRAERREMERLVGVAKRDMEKWASELGHIPGKNEMKAWQSGYIAGINRAAGRAD